MGSDNKGTSFMGSDNKGTSTLTGVRSMLTMRLTLVVTTHEPQEPWRKLHTAVLLEDAQFLRECGTSRYRGPLAAIAQHARIDQKTWPQ